jgi:hypothetical protein
MSEETLFTAARRLVRDLNIDLQKGGIVTVETQMSLHKLEQQIVKQQRADEQAKFIADKQGETK